jgi:hypothetical protein
LTPQTSTESASQDQELNQESAHGAAPALEHRAEQVQIQEKPKPKKTKPNKFHWKEIIKAVVQLYVLYVALSLLLLFVFKDAAVLHPLYDVSWKPQLSKLDQLFKTKSKELKIPLPKTIQRQRL